MRVGPSPIPWTQHEPQNMFRDPAKVADPFQTDTPSHTTTDLTSHEIIMTTNPIPIHRDRLLSSKGANRSPEIRKVRKKTSTTLQKKLDAIWTSEAPGTGGVRFGPISTTPPGSKTQPRRRFRAPQSKTGCAEARMTKVEEQDQHSTRRSHSVASTLGSLTAACRWELRQGGHLCLCATALTQMG